MAADKDKKTMDISKPGKSAPDTSSRPVIVTHSPTVQDPMVKTDQTPEETPKPTEPVVHTSRVIQPLTDNSEPEEPKSDSKKTDEEIKEDKTESNEESSEAAVVDAVADQADLGPKNKKMGELSEEEKKKQEELNNLIAEKKYFVPIGQVAHRRNQRAVLVVVALLVILAGVYLAIDAGLVNLNVNLPFDLIKNS
jgi:hypothetical protein